MYQDLTVSSEGDYRSGVYTVVGKVENVGTKTIGDVRVITTFYNADGKVVSLNYTQVFSDKLEPNTSKTFTATPVDYYSGDITSYNTLIQSTIQQPDGTNPTNSPSNTKAPSNSATPPTTTTSPKPSLELTRTTITLIVVIILAITSIAVVLVMYKRKKTRINNNKQ
jgi:hypothetical protein